MAVEKESLRLRDVDRADRAFLFELFTTSSEDVQALTSLEQPLRDQLLETQFQAHANHVADRFPNAMDQIIEFQDQPVGRVCFESQAKSIHVVELALLPRDRRIGIGSQVISHIQKLAEENGLPVTLRVAKQNSAVEFYRASGFSIVGEQSLHWVMESASSPVKIVSRQGAKLAKFFFTDLA